MRQSRWGKPADNMLTWAWVALFVLIAILGSISCISLPEGSGRKRSWETPIYYYNPTVAKKCQITDFSTEHSLDCEDPAMYQMFCAPLPELKKLETDVIGMCKSWK